MTCPFATVDDHQEDPGGPLPGEPPSDDPRVGPPGGLVPAERKRLRQMIEEVMNEFEGDTDAEVLAEAVRRVGERLPTVPGVAEEAVSDTVRDRVFKLPDLPEIRPLPVVGRGVSQPVPRPSGLFMFDATQKLFGLMNQLGARRLRAGAGGGGEPGGGTGQGGGARG